MALLYVILGLCVLVMLYYASSKSEHCSHNTATNLVSNEKSYNRKPLHYYRDCLNGDKSKCEDVDYNGRDFIAIDFETATWDGVRHICQIGIAKVHDGKLESYNYMVRPYRNQYDKRNIDIHGITPLDTENCNNFIVVWEKIKDLFEDGYIIAHNTDFDVNVLKENLSFYGLDLPNFFDTYCTCSMNGYKSLKYCCRQYEIELGNHHNAESDAIACAKIYIYLYQRVLKFL